LSDPRHSNPDKNSAPCLERLYPASIAFMIEERSLLWYEDAEEYDELLHEVFSELAPTGAIECILAKNLVDYIWELRRMKRLKHTAINYVMPDAAMNMLAPGGLWENRNASRVREQAASVADGAEEKVGAGERDFAALLRAAKVTPEMIHYEALNNVADRLYWITRECERLESRFHRLLKDFETRRATLAAMAKSLVDREKAEVIDFREAS